MTVRSIAAVAATAVSLIASPAVARFGAAADLVALQQPAAQPAPPGGRANQPPARATTPRPAQPDEKPQVAAIPPPPRPEGQLVNVRVELTITDQRAGAPPIKKTVTVVAADGLLNRIRSFAPAGGIDVPLNVDVVPQLRPGGKIRLSVTIEYVLPVTNIESGKPTDRPGTVSPRTSLQENLNTILDDGKAMVIAQSADPVSDRQVTLEVKATILK